MLRSIGRALGDVAVDGGAEKVCEPRLPKLPPRPARASASFTANASTATSAQNASNGRNLKRDIDSSQETIRFDLTYWWFMTAFKEVPHGVADGPQVAAGTALGRKHVAAGADPPPPTSFGRPTCEKVRKQTRDGGPGDGNTLPGLGNSPGWYCVSPGRLRPAEPAAARSRTCRHRRDRRAAAWVAT